MTLNPSLTELTTAATDAALAAVALLCMLALAPHRAGNAARVRTWAGVFGLLALTAVLGAIAHGFVFDERTLAWLWRPLYLMLGLVVALFVVGAALDFRGPRTARRLLPPMVGLAFLFFAVTQVGSGDFRLFVAYEALAMALALVLYVRLALGRRLAGAGLVALGIVLNIAAAAIQASGAVELTVGVPFDHNGVFHLVQMPALAVLTLGLVRGMRRA